MLDSDTGTIDLSVVIPAYNEQATIGKTIYEISECLTYHCPHLSSHEIIVVDDNSTDDTFTKAWDAEASLVLTHPNNKGYGASIKTGVRAAKNSYILTCDGDLTYHTDHLPLMVKRVAEGYSVIGARLISYSNPIIHRLGRRFINWFARRVTGFPIQDLNSGMRIFPKIWFETLPQDQLPNRFSLSSTLTLMAYYSGLEVSHVDCRYRRREGRSKFAKFSMFFKIGLMVLRVKKLYERG